PQLLLGRQGRRDLRLRRIPRAVLRTPRSPGAGAERVRPPVEPDPSGAETKTPDHERRIVADTEGPSMSTLWIGPSRKMNKTLPPWAGDSREEEQTPRGARGRGQGPAGPPGRGAPAGVQPLLVPPFPAPARGGGVLGTDSPVLLGVQNAHWEDAGAWTGEVSV